MKEVSNYNCPVCKVHKLLKSKYGYQCECGFRFGNKIAEREIPDDQIKNCSLLVKQILSVDFIHHEHVACLLQSLF